MIVKRVTASLLPVLIYCQILNSHSGAAVPEPLIPDEIVNSRDKGSFQINPGNCANEQLGPPDQTFTDGSYFDMYTLQWPGGDLNITLSTEIFDEYLILFEPPGFPSGNRIDIDDPDFDLPEVYSRANAPAGVYTILANSYQEATGAYLLCVSSGSGPTATPSGTPTSTKTPTPTPSQTRTPTLPIKTPTQTPTSGGASPIERADYNWDGVIDSSDLSRFLKEWQIPSAAADIDANNHVNDRDQWAFAAVWFRKNLKAIPTRVNAIINLINQVPFQSKLKLRNTNSLLRQGAPIVFPELSELIQMGSDIVPLILDSFKQPPALYDDIPLSGLAYVLEMIGDTRAIPVLADWLESSMSSDVLHAPDFVTHTLKVLDGQSGLNTSGYHYLAEEMLDTIAQARIGMMAKLSKCCDCADKATGDSENSCQKSLHISGINSQGQQVTVSINYRVFKYSTLQLIDNASDPGKKAKLVELYDSYVSADDTRYGGSEYVPVDGAKAGHQSNCGGTVCRRVINELALAKGIPINLGEGTANADDLTSLGRIFGDEVPLSGIDKTTIISHLSKPTGSSIHVEVPIATNGQNATVLSKDQQGLMRQHTVNMNGYTNQFKGFYSAYDSAFYQPTILDTRFYRINPNRIVSIVIDSSACACNPNAPDAIPVTISKPSAAETTQRVVTVEGSVGDPNVTSEAVMRVNGTPQQIAIMNQSFSAVVVLRSGDNLIEVYVETPDGRRGCTKKSIKSTTPRTSISATLTWSLDECDVDLYVTQPNGQTAWYLNKSPLQGGRLDVDNTRGYGPENYFLSAPEGSSIPTGTYTIRVHYFRDRKVTAQQPIARSVGWRVVLLLNEGTPHETREVLAGFLSQASSANDQPGSAGPDWATATSLDYQIPGP